MGNAGCGVESSGTGQVDIHVLGHADQVIIECTLDGALEVGALKQYIHGRTGTPVPLQNLQQVLDSEALDEDTSLMDVNLSCGLADLTATSPRSPLLVKMAVHAGPFAVRACPRNPVRLWDLGSNSPIYTFPTGSHLVNCMAASWESHRLLCGGAGLKVFNLGTGMCTKTLTLPGTASSTGEDEIVCLALDSLGRSCVCGTSAGKLILWDLEASKPSPWIIHEHARRVLCVEADFQLSLFVSASQDGAVDLKDADANRITHLEGHRSWVQSMRADFPSERLLTGSVDGSLKLWDLKSACVIMTLDGHKNLVKSVDMSWEIQQALSCDLDGSMILWDLESGSTLREFCCSNGVTSLTADLSARRALTGSKDRILRLWSLETGSCLADFRGHPQAITALLVDWQALLARNGPIDWKTLEHKASISEVRPRNSKVCHSYDAYEEDDEEALLPDDMPSIFMQLPSRQV
eukprot:TRINITY_DN91339_c0_g1_i1.p1 TRINITY_DN91339_c0_g1~~TRINITY_DN91339_c0_g1_i1.p1  ORF type:complete len:474 (-),score=64.86 TRINITY_DN91339_c0_g1_i1:110-1501(-)